MNARYEAVMSYFNQPRLWTLFDLEVLSHHFCSPEPFERAHAPGYPPVVAKLRRFGLMELDSHEVTATGIQFISSLCNTPIPSGEIEGSGRNLADAHSKEDRS